MPSDLIGRSFASADVTGVDLSPSTLEGFGRQLALKGNALFDMRVDPIGGLTMLPVASWDIKGEADPATWQYALNIASPSGQTTVYRAGVDVIHARINALPEAPYSGRSPLVAAGYSAKLVANLELRTGEEASAKVGALLKYTRAIPMHP